MPRSHYVKPYWAKHRDKVPAGLAAAALTREGANKATVDVPNQPKTATPTGAPLVAAPANPTASAYLTTEEAGHFVRLSPRTLERLRVHGTGPAYLRAGIGKRARVLYKVEHLVAWLEGQSYTSTSDYIGV